LETWLLIFFTATQGGVGSGGTEANYVQFKTIADCQDAIKSLSELKVSAYSLNYSPKAVCVKNGTPIIPNLTIK
jgi:hypothetical protein